MSYILQIYLNGDFCRPDMVAVSALLLTEKSNKLVKVMVYSDFAATIQQVIFSVKCLSLTLRNSMLPPCCNHSLPPLSLKGTPLIMKRSCSEWSGFNPTVERPQRFQPQELLWIFDRIACKHLFSMKSNSKIPEFRLSCKIKQVCKSSN